MHVILAWLSMFLLGIKGSPYNSLTDLYDTNYEYEFGDTQAREEVLITQTPQFLSQPLDLVVNEGQTIRLPCLVDRLDGFVLLWRKDEQIISVGAQVLDRSKTRIEIEEAENGNTLVVHQADHSDEAEYVCSVSAYRKTEMKHSVKIRVQPIISTTPEDMLTVKEGDAAVLSCQLQLGTPIPHLKWRKCDGETFLEGGNEILENVIKFEAVTRDDSGCYVCEADNGFSADPVTSKVMLVVEYPPSVQIQKTENSSNAMSISCTVLSEPSAEITWLKDGEMIGKSEMDIFIETHKYKSNLHLLKLDREDIGGRYSCVAENKMGREEKSANISGGELDTDSNANKNDNRQVFTHGTTVKERTGGSSYESTTSKPKQSDGKIYFARVPSFYTLPEKETKPLLQKRNNVFQNPPKNAQEFLQLLRIYNRYRSIEDKNNSIVTEEHLTPEQTTANNLLRSTHSYLRHLGKQLERKTNSESENDMNNASEKENDMNNASENENDMNNASENENDMNNASENEYDMNNTSENEYDMNNASENEQEKEDSPFVDELKPSITKTSKIIEKGEKDLKRKQVTEQSLFDTEVGHTSGRYLKEKDILTVQPQSSDHTESVYSSNKNPALRGHHEKHNSLGIMKPEDLFIHPKPEKKEQQELIIENIIEMMSANSRNEEIIHKSMLEENVEDLLEIAPMETKSRKLIPISGNVEENDKTGKRYLNAFNEIEEDNKENETSIPVLRGQHLLQKNLKDLDSMDYAVLSNLKNEAGNLESLKITQSNDQEIKTVENKWEDLGEFGSGGNELESPKPDHNSENEINYMKDEKENTKEAAYFSPKVLKIRESSVDKIKGSRYLNENQVIEEIEDISGDPQLTKSNVLRGHHLFLSSLADTNEERPKPYKSNSDIKIQFEPTTISHAGQKDATQDGEPNDDKVEEYYYPKEIRNIEKMYFKHLSNFELTDNAKDHPLLHPKEKESPQKMILQPKQDEEMEEDATRHPLMIPTMHTYTETEAQIRGEHFYMNGLNQVNGETFIGEKNDELVLPMTKPIRGDHSYDQKIEEVQHTVNDVKETIQKNRKTQRRSHPFAGLRFKLP